MDPRLSEHYELKYQADARNSTTIVSFTSFPTNRHEAAVHFIKRHFKGRSILEFGAGQGVLLKSLIACDLEFKRYVATDVSSPRIEALRRNVMDSRVTVEELDAESGTANHQGKYDAIILVALIEHLVDPLSALARMSQLLNPGGFIYIDTPNIAKYTRRVKLLFGRFPSTASKNEGLTTYDGQNVDLLDEGHLHYFTYKSISSMLTTRCGFSRVQRLGYFHGRQYFGKALCRTLARSWPSLFSDIVVLAYR